jgi:hypothetical protein
LPLPFSISHQSFVCISHLSHACYACYMPRLSHLPWFHHPNVWRNVQIMKPLTTQSSPASHSFLSLRSKYSHTPFSSTHNLCSSLRVRDQVSKPYKQLYHSIRITKVVS